MLRRRRAACESGAGLESLLLLEGGGFPQLPPPMRPGHLTLEQLLVSLGAFEASWRPGHDRVDILEDLVVIKMDEPDRRLLRPHAPNVEVVWVGHDRGGDGAGSIYDAVLTAEPRTPARA